MVLIPYNSLYILYIRNNLFISSFRLVHLFLRLIRSLVCLACFIKGDVLALGASTRLWVFCGSTCSSTIEFICREVAVAMVYGPRIMVYTGGKRVRDLVVSYPAADPQWLGMLDCGSTSLSLMYWTTMVVLIILGEDYLTKCGVAGAVRSSDNSVY